MPRGKISVSKKDNSELDTVKTGKTSNFTLVKPIVSTEDFDTENDILATDEKPVSNDGVFTIILIAVFIAVNIALVALLNDDKKPASIVKSDLILREDKPVEKPKIEVQPKPQIQPQAVLTPTTPVNNNPIITEQEKPVVNKQPVKAQEKPQDLLSIISKE